MAAGAAWRLDEILEIVQLSLEQKKPRSKQVRTRYICHRVLVSIPHTPCQAIPVSAALQHLSVIMRSSQTMERLRGRGVEHHRVMPLVHTLAKFHVRARWSCHVQIQNDNGTVAVYELSKLRNLEDTRLICRKPS